jgi:sterol desaturase/sphingolipid hydroxylase (fatty acid hydroxylase superfamily)
VSTETQSARRADVLKASPQMFESRLLDKLSRVHPVVVPLIYVPAIVVFSVLALQRLSVLEWIAYAVGGYVFWTISEYAIHRFVFHFEPEKGIGARLHWIIHGVHHDHPNDPLRLVMPPSVSVPLSALFFGLFWLVLSLGGAFAVASGFFSGYLAYDMTHYYVHHRMPKSALGRKLRELHMRHHFQDDTKGYGISAPWWDVVFRTYSKQRRRRRPAPSV